MTRILVAPDNTSKIYENNADFRVKKTNGGYTDYIRS